MTAHDIDPTFLRLVQTRIARVRASSLPGTPEEDLRTMSNDLRALTEHGELHRAWRMLDLEPKRASIRAPRLEPQTGDRFIYLGYARDHYSSAATPLVGEPFDTIEAAVEAIRRAREDAPLDNFSPFASLIGQGKDGKHYVSPPAGTGTFAVTDGSASLDDDRWGHDHLFPWSEFLESCAIFAEERKITRQRVISFVANTQGGSHWDPQLSGSGKKTRQDFEILKRLGDAATTQDRNAVFYAFLGIAQAIVDAEDVHRLEEQIARIVSGFPRRR